MGGSSQTTNSTNNSTSNVNGTSTSAPGWAPQVADLTQAFGLAPGALTNAMGVTGPTFTNANLSQNGTVANSGGALTQAGTNAAQSGLASLTGYNPSATNNPSSLITAANQFVAGQNIPAQVQAAMLPAEQQANQVTLPGITQNANIGGNADSSRTGIAQGLVEQGLGEQSAALNGSLSGTAFANGLNLAETAANNNNTGALTAAADAASAGTSGANTGSNLVSGALNNTGTANNINQTNFSNQTGDPYAALANYMQLIGGTNWGSTTNTTGTTTGTSNGTSTTESDPSAWSVIGGLLGAGGSAAGGVGQLLKYSDRRIKEDIVRVGTLDNGLPVYLFRYKGQPEIHMGLMAQDVEAVNPDAVVQIGDIKAVNYVKASL